jgi:DNA-directed RNA polymerase specialized sigma24 family protein
MSADGLSPRQLARLERGDASPANPALRAAVEALALEPGDFVATVGRVAGSEPGDGNGARRSGDERRRRARCSRERQTSLPGSRPAAPNSPARGLPPSDRLASPAGTVAAAAGASVNDSSSIDQVLPALCRRLRWRINGMLFKYGIPAQDGEDVIQTVLLLAVNKWHEIHDPKAWLLGTLKNRCIIYRRERLKHACRFVPLAGIRPHAAAMPPPQAERELMAELSAAWRRLPRTQRRLVVLRCQLGLSTLEAAQAAGVAHSSVRKLLGRALARLRGLLGEPPRPAKARASPRPGPPRLARRRPPAPPEWTAAVETWLGISSHAPSTTRNYRGYLAAAGVALHPTPLEDLAPSDLASYRTALLTNGWARYTHQDALRVLRSFLLWARQRGLHAVDAESVCLALRGSHAGRPPSPAAANRRRRSNPLKTDR